MCDFADRVTKISQIAAQTEYELTLELAHHWHYGHNSGSIAHGEIRRARRMLVLRGDAWALSAFDRILTFLKENRELCEELAKERTEAKPELRADAIREFLEGRERPGYPEALICHEVADLTRGLEEAVRG